MKLCGKNSPAVFGLIYDAQQQRKKGGNKYKIILEEILSLQRSEMDKSFTALISSFLACKLVLLHIPMAGTLGCQPLAGTLGAYGHQTCPFGLTREFFDGHTHTFTVRTVR